MGLGMLAQPVMRMRTFMEQRREPRIVLDPSENTAGLIWRNQSAVVPLGNLSDSGAMVHYEGNAVGEKPNQGERIMLILSDRQRRSGQVMWVREGKVGIRFSHAVRG